MKSTAKPDAPARGRIEDTSSSWPVYEKDQTGAEISLGHWCDIVLVSSIVSTIEARVELVLEFIREWYRNVDYDWQSFYENIATRSDRFPDLGEMERFISLPALPPTFDLERFLDLLDRWDGLIEGDTSIDQAAVEIAACGVAARATNEPARLEVNGVTIDSAADTGFPSKLELLETVCAMQSSCLRRFPEEADDRVRFTNLRTRLRRNASLFKPNPSP